MTRTNEHEAQAEAKTACSVVVVYDDTTAREQAVDFCDQLVLLAPMRISGKAAA